MKYTHGADRRQGTHLTDLIGDDPMFCKVLRIVFTLFFFWFLLGSQYPVSLGPWLQLDDKSLAAATAVPVPVKWRRRRKTISPWLQLDKKSLAVATAVALLFDEPTTVKSSC